MSRSGYSDEYEQWSLIRWRGAVKSAIRGKRGQAFLRELIESLDAMPDKLLIEGGLQTEGGDVCAMGAVALHRGIDASKVDPEEREEVAELFGISPAMAAEIAYENDECAWGSETSAQRWTRMRKWAMENLTEQVQP